MGEIFGFNKSKNTCCFIFISEFLIQKFHFEASN